MRRSFPVLIGGLVLTVGLVVWQGVQMPEDISKKPPVVEAWSAEFVKIVTIANRFVSGSKAGWGDALRVEWQGLHGRYIVVYPTPESELLILGRRSVIVEPDGRAWFPPRG